MAATPGSPPPQVVFPAAGANPLRALARRVAIAIGLLLAVALVTWLGRGGYRDADGDPVSALDALYYASVSVTTTGYGDITPITPAARAWTALVVTPARILFLIVLVGTTIEVLTERFRKAVAISRWRKRVTDHVIVVGYGTKGRGAIQSMLDGGAVAPSGVVVIDVSERALDEATHAGLVGVFGDATRTTVLRQARIEEASAIIVTSNRDDTATLVTLSARELNPRAVIAASVRESENAHLLRQSGANVVIVSSEAAGRVLGLAIREPAAVSVLEDLLVAGRGLQLSERAVTTSEIGGPPRLQDGHLPVAIVRDGVRLGFDDERFARAELGDIVVSVYTERD